MEYQCEIDYVCHRGKISIFNYQHQPHALAHDHKPLAPPWGEETKMDLKISLLYTFKIYIFILDLCNAVRASIII